MGRVLPTFKHTQTHGKDLSGVTVGMESTVVTTPTCLLFSVRRE